MRKLFLAVLSLVAVCSFSFAEDLKTAEAKTEVKTTVHKPHMMPLNNVVKMDADGKRSALCCCGAEFSVTDNAPTMDHDGTHFYMCGDGCKQQALKATKEESAKTMADWRTKYKTYKFADNSFMKDGKKWAKCGCGKEFEVMSDSPMVKENGVKMYCCSEACHEQLAKMTEPDRMKTELAMLKPATTAPKSDTPVGNSK